MNTLNKTERFESWLDELNDKKGQVRIAARLQAAEKGHFGDCASVGEGVSEMRIHFGPGYRVYFAREGINIYLLIAGGDKSSQQNDIKEAKAFWKKVRKVVPHENH